jgi:eukaryotic-like serine/threonine-protein kinase
MTNEKQHLPRESLERLVEGDLPGAEEAGATAHLEECSECRASLDRVAGDRAWWEETALLLRTDENDLALADVSDWSTVDFSVDFLDPADDPTLLGRLGDYEIHDILGRGGMGVVLKARDPQLNRFVAIKALAPQWATSEVARRRFAREAQAAAAVVHPNVIAIHQVHSGGRLPFLVMPLIQGESLQQRLARRGALELVEVLRIGMQAAAGLAAAHEQGLVHRDVKPANILLEPGVERTVLTDFGLARAADDRSLTQWGVIAGTPSYMSPEQARGERLDGRSDLFSLGCVLFEMATGQPPFQAEGTLAILRRVCEEPAPSATSRRPELPAWFDRVVWRLLSKEPAERYQTAREVATLLEDCLAHVQDTALPLPGQLISTRSWSRAGWIIGLILTVGLVVGALWGLGHERVASVPPSNPPSTRESPAPAPAFDPAWNASDRELLEVRQRLDVLESNVP